MKISQVLIDSDKTRTQVRGRLVHNRDPITGEPQDYCALGALACEKNLINTSKDEDNISYTDIISAYGIDPYTKVIMPEGSNWLSGERVTLSSAIFRLNDHYKWSFKKIGKWLEKQEKKGVIKYDD